jgi:hypothetical protein
VGKSKKRKVGTTEELGSTKQKKKGSRKQKKKSEGNKPVNGVGSTKN